MARPALHSLLALVLLSGCSDDAATPANTDAGTDTGNDSAVADTAGAKNDGEPPKDLSADPLPASMATAVGFQPPSGPADQPLDLSCLGTPMPIATGAVVDRTVKTAELGDTTALVPETDVEIFYANKLGGAADVTGKTAAGTAQLAAKIAPGFFLARTKKSGLLETVAYDWWIDKEPVFTFAIAVPAKVEALEALSGGVEFKREAGTSRLVVQVRDCKRNNVSNAHVVIEIGGKIVAPVTTGPGIYRNYLGDNELPSEAKVSSRSGVVAFLNVPASAPVRLIAYGKTAAGIVPFAIRTLPPVADGVVTALVSPWIEP
ncbi:MAG: hypothetical protein HYV09_10135 [Deltaproteobacteria bacterium]|nr:hypothetical protein [Deltaproteobacteria bacterium]